MGDYRMKQRDVIAAFVVVTAIAVVGCTIAVNEDCAVKQETTFVSLDPMMPRSSNPFCMEVADIEYIAMTATPAPAEQYTTSENSFTAHTSKSPSQGQMLTASGGVFYGASGKETWYNADMSGVIDIMRHRGFNEISYPYWIRDDGCKMLGDYIILAANLDIRPRGTVLETSRGLGIVCDTGSFAQEDITALDLATNW